MKDRYYKAALAFANEFRGELGLEALTELPKGKVGAPTRCPLANVVPGGSATASTVASWQLGKLRQKVCPDEVSLFIKRFDAGFYPELQQ